MWRERPVLVAESSWGRRGCHGAAECSRWEGRWWGMPQGLLIAAAWLVVGSCQWWAACHAASRVLPYLGWVPGSQWKTSPPLLFSATCILKINNYLLSGVGQLGPCHLYLPCYPHKSGPGYFNYLFVGLLERIPLVMRQFNERAQENGFSTCAAQTFLQMEVKELWKPRM